MIKIKLKWWKSHAWHWIISDANIVLIIQSSTLISLFSKNKKLELIESNKTFFTWLNWILENYRTFFNNNIILFELKISKSISYFIYV